MTEPQPSRPVPVDHATTTEHGSPSVGDPSDRSSLGNIYLRPPAAARKHRLVWPVRLMRLEHYPEGLITEKVRNELTILALMLLAVFIFEFAAWSFFFNGLFVGDVDRFRPGGTAAAILFGFLFGGAVLYFERQVITADTWRLTRWKRWSAQGVRVLAIAVAGYAVAHAVDLLAFRVPVARSLHAGAVDQEEIRLRADIDRLAESVNTDRRSALEKELTIVRDRIRSAQNSREQAAADKGRFRAQIESLESEARSRGEAVNQAEANLVRIEDEADRTALRRAQTELGAARSRYDLVVSDLLGVRGDQAAAQAVIEEKDSLIEALLADENRLREQQSALSTEKETVEAAARVLEGRLGQWVADLRRSAPGDRTEKWDGFGDAPADERRLWPEEWRTPLEFVEPQVHFFEKITKVYELAFGEPRATGEHSVQTPSNLDRSQRSDRWLSKVYRSSFVAIHLAAVFLPLLVFAVKWFLMPKEVDAYFSTWHQAFAGDSDARSVLSVEEKVRRRDERW